MLGPTAPQTAPARGSTPADPHPCWAGGERGDFLPRVGGDLAVPEREPAGPFLMDDGTWQEVLAVAAPSLGSVLEFIAAGMLTCFLP